MKKKFLTIVISMMLISLTMVGIAYAQEAPNGNELEDLDDERILICDGTVDHPTLLYLAEIFDVAYEELLVYFCEYDFGIGEIKLALVTAQQSDGELTYQDILEWRLVEDGENGEATGWGIIWQELGLIGRNRKENGLHQFMERFSNQGEGEKNFGNGNAPFVPPGLSNGFPGKGNGPKK